MPTIVFNPGDVFKCANGFGLVLASRSMYLLAEGEGGRTGRTLRRTAILSNNAQPVVNGVSIPYEVKFAFKAVVVAGQFPYSPVLDD
ncbi:MAG: hypothetical protein ABIK27_09210 [Bacteroidota bacterium]